jgi:hypothetical protein
MSRKLTIGMACYDDMEGTYFTIQSLRMHHPEVMDEVEFVIIDNNPSSAHGEAVKRFSTWIRQPVRYVPFTESTGAANAKQEVFNQSQTPYVLCMDCHILLVPGAIRKLIDGFEAGWDKGNLLHGPMLYDDLQVGASHMSHFWRGGMLGIWAIAWRCPCGEVYQSYRREDENGAWLEMQTLQPPPQALTACSQCDLAFPAETRWEGHEKALEEAGMTKAADGEPFEIPCHGMGLFACRKDAWLGFNPHFRGFGGEECYIHEKFRQAGKTSYCLPFLRWLHRFERPGGIPYPVRFEERIWNFLVGHTELGMDPQPVIDHFAALLSDVDIQIQWADGQPVQVELRESH